MLDVVGRHREHAEEEVAAVVADVEGREAHWAIAYHRGMKPLAKAVEHLAAGEWEKAHEIVQKDESKLSSWLHGIVHIIEGDEKNAQGWYKRAERPFPGMSGAKTEIAAARKVVDAS